MVTPAGRGGEPHRVTVKPTPQDQQTRAEFEAIFRASADKSPRPDTVNPPPLNRKGSVLKPQPEGSLLSRVMNFILKLLGLKSGAQKTQFVKEKLARESIPPQISLEQALEKARQGGPAKEVFVAVRENPVQTKELAQSRHKTLKQQIEHQTDPTSINKLGKKLDLPRDAAFGVKVETATKQIEEKKAAVVAQRERGWSQTELLENKFNSLSTDLEKSQNMSAELARENATLSEQTNTLLDEKEKLTKDLDETETGRVVFNREEKVANLNEAIKKNDKAFDSARTRISNNEETIKTAHEERINVKAQLSELPDEIDKTAEENTKLSTQIEALDQSMRELNAVKLKAGEENEALLEQLLNSFVLERAVEAYAENPQQQAPEQFLFSYKLLHREELKRDFLKELEEIGIIPPDIIWEQLTQTLTEG